MTLFHPLHPIFICMLKDNWLFPLTSFEIVNSIQSLHCKLDLPVTKIPKVSLHYVPKSPATPPKKLINKLTPNEPAITRKEGHDKKHNPFLYCQEQTLLRYINENIEMVQNESRFNSPDLEISIVAHYCTCLFHLITEMIKLGKMKILS